ncbi:MAG TPA: hypothetical protein VMI13_04460 [Solirubrobacteraceae bacterium]|nr:hypothetical protein [Solirubrobacteraceae bacterium]
MSLTNPHPKLPSGALSRRLLSTLLAAACLYLSLTASAFAWNNPVNISPPTVTGTAQQGKTLTEHHGEWTNTPNSYTYQWRRCNSSGSSCSSIGGATGETYLVTSEDVGHELRVAETAYNFGAPSAPEDSSATAVVLPAAPVATTVPTITGTAQQGKTLEEHHGEWTNSPTGYTYRWQRCTSAGTSCTAIGGATNQTYVPVAEDVGHKLKVTETASNAGGSGTPAESKATAVVVPPVPTNSKVPTITGTAQQGKTLEEHHGEWTNSPTGYTYQWMRCEALGGSCLPISGATNETYVPVAEDVGHKLRVTEVASNAGGSSSAAESAATAVVVPPVPVNSKVPTVTGTAQQGKTLEEHHGEWSNSPTGYSYQWLRCNSSGASCVAIGGATAATYSPVAEDVEQTLRVTEVASNSGGSSAAAESEATSVVLPAAPVNSKVPTVTGTAQQGKTLEEHHGEWSNSPTEYSYQWLRCNSSGASCVAIGGATAATYSPVAEDVEQTLRVTEVATNAGGPGAAAESAATAVVTPPVPVNSKVPTVTGTAQQGKTLEEHNGEWTNAPTGYTYQWMRCNSSGSGCVAIGGATAATYSPVGEDVGHELRIAETASNAGGAGSAAESEATAVVVPPVPANSKVPTVTGIAAQGGTLTEHHGEWTNSPTGYEYQWLRCDSSGSSCSAIGGAAEQTYIPVGEDVGHTLRVAETASNAGGSGAAAESVASAVVTPPVPVNTKAPIVTGTAKEGDTLEAQPGEWSESPTGYEYQWLRCDESGNGCAPIAGAAAEAYVLGAEDVGHTLVVSVTASNAGGPGAPAESAATAVVVPSVPANSNVPTVTGTAQQGQTLTEHHGEWTNSPTGYEYQWLRCDSSGSSCSAIGGATEQTYIPVGEDVGHTLRVSETASNAGGAGTAAESQATAVVVPPVPADSALPTVSGTAQQGETLTAHHGEWTNSPTEFANHWMRCDASGNGCAAIEGASGETYVLTGEDVGHTLRVAETASNAGGSGSAAESDATATVAAPPVVKTTPPPAEDPPDPPAETHPAPAVVLSVSAVRITRWGNAVIPLACPATASTGCKGTLVITYVVRKAHSKRAVASLLCARGCRELGKAKYEARAGQKVKIRVHIASAVHHKIDQGNTVTATLTATSLSEGHTTTVSHKLALEPPHA